MPSTTRLQTRTSCATTSASWAELRTSDPEAAKSFYSGLFGWAYFDQPMPDGPHFSVAMAEGRPIAVIAPAITAQHQPPTWISHRGANEVDPGPLARITASTTVQTRAANGTQSIVADDAIDADDARIGRRNQDSRGPRESHDLGSYSIFLIDGVPLAGIATAAGPEPSTYPLVSFAVVDTDAAVVRVTTLGGRSLRDPIDTPTGRICQVADPQGAAFNLLQPIHHESRSDVIGQPPDGRDQLR